MLKLTVEIKEKEKDNVNVGIKPQKDMSKASDSEILVGKELFDYLQECLKNIANKENK